MSSVSRFLHSATSLLFPGILLFSAATWAQTAHFSGAVTSAYGFSGYYVPMGVAMDANGNFFVASYGESTEPGDSWVSEIPAGCTSAKCVLTLGGGFFDAWGVAVDANENVYVGDYGNGAVKKIPPGCASSSCVVTLGGGFINPAGVAVDTHGNVYVADYYNNAVKEMPPGCTSSACVTTLGGGFSEPKSVAVDQYGNVFVADYFNNAVKKMASGCASSACVATLGGGFRGPMGVAVDANDNVYVADSASALVKKIPPGCTSSSCVATLGGGFTSPADVAVDQYGNVFVSDGVNRLWEISMSAGNFGNEPVGGLTYADVLLVTFTFDTAGSGVAPAVLTQGAAGLDFKDAGTGSCTTNGTGHSYGIGETCAVNVTFTPKHPGPRNGAVILQNSSGATIATGYVFGTGMGPQVNFSPFPQTTLGSGFSNPNGAAVDSSGNVFVADTGSGLVKEIMAAGGYTTVRTLSTYDFNQPQGVAVDGAGNVFVADINSVEEILASGGYTTVRTLSTYDFAQLQGVAVDGSGNVYVTDSGWGQVDEIVAAGGYTQVVPIFSYPNPGAPPGTPSAFMPYGVAVDGGGNVFFSDWLNGTVTELPAGGVPTQLVSGFSNPTGMAVDAGGNVFVADTGNGAVKEIPYGCTSSTCVTTLGKFSAPAGLALDGSRNLFVSGSPDGANFGVTEWKLSSPPSLSFATTKVGSTSSDSPQTVTVENAGNADLEFQYPASGTNPGISANFTLNSSGASACPETTPGSPEMATLAAGQSCLLPISFSPTAVGALTGSLTMKDNSGANPDTGWTTQTISLSGTGDAQTTIVWPSPAPITYGTTLDDSLAAGAVTGNYNPISGMCTGCTEVPGTFAYTATPAGGKAVAVTAATILGAGSYTLTANFTPTDTTDFTMATASVPLTVKRAAPEIAWDTPLPVSSGTALSATQLDAWSPVAGMFVYSPVAGTVPPLGETTLSVTFTPTDSADFTTATAAVTLTVTPVGTVNIGSTSPATSLSFTFAAAATLGSINVVTQGTAGLDFANAGGGTCKAGTQYSAGATCTVNVSFKPKFSGFRYGAVVLEDASENVLATDYISAAGSGPQVEFWIGSEMLVGNGLNSPSAVAADGNGNLYIADTGNNRILKETLSAGSYTQSVVPTSTLSSPDGVAVDGSGNVYIADYFNNQVLKETPSGATYIESTVGSGTPKPLAVAVDGSGNVYVLTSYATGEPQQILKETLSAGNYTPSQVIPANYYFTGVAVDGNGNVYFSEILEDELPGTGGVFKLTPSSTGYTESTVDNTLNAVAVAVDGNGNVYAVDQGTYGAWSVLEETSSAGFYNQNFLPITAGLVNPVGVSVDGMGNVYLSDSSSSLVLKQDFGDPPSLGFTATNVGSMSSDSPQTVTITNIGNQPLNLSTPGTGGNPSYPVNFPENTSDPNLCAAGTSLAPNEACDVSINFVPTTGGTNYESVVITDNNLNQTNATQSIRLTGTGTLIQQTITFPAITAAQYALTTLPLSATASSGLAVSLTSSTPSICTVSGSTASLLTPGTCILHAAQAGNSNYSAAPAVSQGFYVHPAQQTITFKTITGAWYALQQITLSATASSGLAVSFSTTTPTVCTVSGNTVSLLIGGSCILQATQAGNALYGAALPVTQVVVVHLAHQSITVTPVTGTKYALSQLALSASSNSGLPVTLTSVTPAVCTLSGNTASFLTAGTCDIHANQAGNATYATAPLLAVGIDVHPIIQTINFTTVATPVYPLTKVTLSATATSWLNVSFASITTTVCTVSVKTLSLLTSGNCILHALQNGNPDYAAAPIVTQQVYVTPLSQTITWPTITGTRYAASQMTLTATASSGLTVAFVSTTPAVCTVAGATASLLASGTCILRATQAGNAIYAAAPVVQQSVVVHLAPQTITFTAVGGQTVGANVTLSATASSGLTVSFASVTGTVCTVSGTTATMLTAGTCTIHATQAGNTTYSAAPLVSQSITVKAAS